MWLALSTESITNRMVEPSPSDNLPPAARYLGDKGIPYRLYRHAGPVRSLEQAARERHLRPDQIVRSIVFRVGKASFVMVLMAGRRQVAWPVLRRYLGQTRLTMATEDEVRQVTGSERGGVSPLGLPGPMRILADASVFVPEEISIGSGVPGTTVIMASADLKTALGDIEGGSFGEDES